MRRFLIAGAVVAAAILLAVAAWRWTTRPGEPTHVASDAWSKTVGAKMLEIHQKQLAAPPRTGILAEPNRYSLFGEEVLIRDFFQDRRDGFFLDVGCAWPIKSNNTYYLEKHLGWRGIGIDALADYGDAWKHERPGSRFFAYLVSDRSSDEETFYKSEDSGLSSTNREWATGKGFGIEMNVEEIEVPSTTLDALLEREQVQDVDLLAMDIEGYELPALRGFDLERYRPELIVTEGDSKEVQDYLAAHGYELIEKYLAYDSVNRYFRRTRG